MEAPIFLLFCCAVGYLLFWMLVNEKRDPNGGHDGWFAIKPPAKENDTLRSADAVGADRNSRR